jgi:hypothetical protein
MIPLCGVTHLLALRAASENGRQSARFLMERLRERGVPLADAQIEFGTHKARKATKAKLAAALGITVDQKK